MRDNFVLGVDNTPDWFIKEINNVYIHLDKCVIEIKNDNELEMAYKGDCIGRIGDRAYIIR